MDTALAVGPAVDAVGQHSHAPVPVEQGDGFHAVHPGFHFGNTGFHPDNVAAKVHQCKVQPVDADVQQRAPGQGRIENPGYAGNGIGQIGGEGIGGADDAAVQELIEHLPGGHIPGPDGLRHI